MPDERDESGSNGHPNATESQPEASPEAPSALEQMTQERDRLKDQLLRSLADFDNFRKRARKETEDSTRRGQEDVLKALLPVFDNLERAAQYAAGGADPKAIGEGVQMTLRLFESTIEKLGGK